MPPHRSATSAGCGGASCRHPDPARARKFYSAVMGWTPKIVSLTDSSRPPAQGEKDYTLFTIEGREVAGAMQTEGDADTPAAIWLTYIHVANVDVCGLESDRTRRKSCWNHRPMPQVRAESRLLRIRTACELA